MSQYRLVETIRVLDSRLQNLPYHQRRLEYSFLHFYPQHTPFKLSELITVPQTYVKGLVKARFLYNASSFALEFHHYTPKKINCLRLVRADWIDYSFKYTDRSQFEALLRDTKGCNEVLIVKNGQVTDTSFSNIVFFDGKKWLTPTTYLLAGTFRQYLLDTGKITQAPIRPGDLRYFTHFKLINALLAWDMEPLPIDKIIV